MALQLLEQAEQIGFTLLRLDVVLVDQAVADFAYWELVGHEFPGACADGLEAMIHAGLEVKNHDFVGDVAVDQFL